MNSYTSFLNQPTVDLIIRSPKPATSLPGFLSLMGKGVRVGIKAGDTLVDLVCGRLGVERDYLKHRVQTIFLNSQPVNDAGKALLADGDMVALSAAMPGLVGATLRKGGHLADFRKRISHQKMKSKEMADSDGCVTVRLFNVIAKELGPSLMVSGQCVDGDAVLLFIKFAAACLKDVGASIALGEKGMSLDSVLRRDYSKDTVVRLTILSEDAI